MVKTGLEGIAQTPLNDDMIINRNKTFEKYFPMVKSVTRELAFSLPENTEIADLLQDGSIGLINAIDNYDPKKGGFSSFTYWKIKNEILEGLRDRDTFGRTTLDLKKNIAKTQEYLRQEYGEEPSTQEISENMEIPETQVIEALTIKKVSLDIMKNVSLENTIYVNFNYRFKDGLKKLQEKRQREILREAVKENLSKKEQYVVKEIMNESPIEEIGKTLELSGSRISQIYGKAKKTLKTHLAITLGEDFKPEPQREITLNPNVQTYTPAQAAKYLELLEPQIKDLEKTGKLPFVKANGEYVTTQGALDIIKERPKSPAQAKVYYRNNTPPTEREVRRDLCA